MTAVPVEQPDRAPGVRRVAQAWQGDDVGAPAASRMAPALRTEGVNVDGVAFYGKSTIMQMARKVRPIYWVGSSLNDLREFPAEVKDTMGYALHLAQMGSKHPQSKPLKGFGGAGVLEIVEDHAGDTYRTVYTVRFGDAIYVLHAFQKKSKSGIKTPKKELDLVRDRLRRAEMDHATH